MFQSQNPATGDVWRTYDELSATELEAKIALAAQAFLAHRATPISERASCMKRAADILEQKREEWAQLMVREMGKTIESARQEVTKCAKCCRFYADHAPQMLADQSVETEASRAVVRFQPLGPVLAVMPWNFPFWQVIRFAAPALMAGNVGLLKHAANVPGCAQALEDLFTEAGFTKGAFQNLFISVEQTGNLLEDKRIAAATLTGSERAGKSLGESAGRNLKKIVLELGGSDPFIVMPSADLEKAAQVAVQSRLLCNGQSCIAAKRFIIHAKVYDKFQKAFVAAMRSQKMGDPMDESTQLGPLANEKQREQLHKQVQESVQAGANLTCGGELPSGPGYFYPATVLENIPTEAPVYSEEVFGPVAALYRVESFDAALELANGSSFGLGAALWSREENEIEAFTTRIESGSAFVNALVASDPRLPFGGIKNSGVGRELSDFGLREFLNIKTIWVA